MLLKVIDVSYLQECINFEVKTGDKTCNFISLYRSSSQTKYEFENFIKNLELDLEYIVNQRPFLFVVLGHFNGRMQGWYQNYIATFEGSKIDMATSQYSLIFTSQPNLIHSGVRSSLHPNRHHQIVFAKFNLRNFLSSALQTISLVLSASKY